MKFKLLKSIYYIKNIKKYFKNSRNLFPTHAREKGGTEAFSFFCRNIAQKTEYQYSWSRGQKIVVENYNLSVASFSALLKIIVLYSHTQGILAVFFIIIIMLPIT